MNWISVKDGLPEIGREVLVWNRFAVAVGGRHWCCARYYPEWGWRSEPYVSPIECLATSVTHWLDPEPPEGAIARGTDHD